MRFDPARQILLKGMKKLTQHVSWELLTNFCTAGRLEGGISKRVWYSLCVVQT